VGLNWLGWVFLMSSSSCFSVIGLEHSKSILCRLFLVDEGDFGDVVGLFDHFYDFGGVVFEFVIYLLLPMIFIVVLWFICLFDSIRLEIMVTSSSRGI
jgi:hypothetical protein